MGLRGLVPEAAIALPTSFRIKIFHGLQDGYEDPADFIEDIEASVERAPAREVSALSILGQGHLRASA
ncbi:hypothetical protein N7519_000304 [Penicillium mononematosum]|uniref:uncharacterized protein n=1 Tax=Penicillium mononematosum TaxID=268346 RepID=UPI0025471644|nr:uncharacterized protein N7519_000304 [Penicillium mononematosum]KAJ6190283.1 hypothetical protein N7519_000304 [Penicillium mononematosum]